MEFVLVVFGLFVYVFIATLVWEPLKLFIKKKFDPNYNGEEVPALFGAALWPLLPVIFIGMAPVLSALALRERLKQKKVQFAQRQQEEHERKTMGGLTSDELMTVLGLERTEAWTHQSATEAWRAQVIDNTKYIDIMEKLDAGQVIYK